MSSHIFIFPHYLYPTNSVIQDSDFIHCWFFLRGEKHQELHTLCTNCLSCSFPGNVNIITCSFLELVLTFVSYTAEGLGKISSHCFLFFLMLDLQIVDEE